MKKNQKGFTLIEVILVLAVGSLIFAMAFIAYGQASTNRRDTQRRADLGKIASALEDYASDNNGKYPLSVGFQPTSPQNTFLNGFYNDYVGNLNDPSGSAYKNIKISTDPGFLTYRPEEFVGKIGELTFCDGTSAAGNTRDYVIKMKLEKGEACRDSRQ